MVSSITKKKEISFFYMLDGVRATSYKQQRIFSNYLTLKLINCAIILYKMSTVELNLKKITHSKTRALLKSLLEDKMSKEEVLNYLQEDEVIYEESSAFYNDYLDIVAEEDEMKDTMYTSYAKPEMSDNLYNLIEVTSIDTQKIKSQKVLFTDSNLKNYTDDCRQDYLDNLHSTVPPMENVLIAGGSAFSILYDSTPGDIDLFIFGLDEEQANMKIEEILSKVEYEHICRSKNALTISTTKTKIQIILRLYKTISEVLHGFDVDSCCIGYYKGKIYCTKRALYSLKNGVNVVNFDRLSPSYEYRLVKYALKGVSVYVPNFDRSKVLTSILSDYADSTNCIGKEKGLSILLFMDYKQDKYNSLAHNSRSIEKEDYDYTKTSRGCYLSNVVNFDCSRSLMISNLYWGNRKIKYIKGGKCDTKEVISFSFKEKLESSLKRKCIWDIPLKIEWKVTKPGEQMTNTFNRIVLSDNNTWYKGLYYA